MLFSLNFKIKKITLENQEKINSVGFPTGEYK